MFAHRPTLLVLSQVYVPDPASVGQHMADVATKMVRRGWRVAVLTAARGYNDPRIRYRPREVIDGVEVIRLPLASFGKRSFILRILAAGLFVVQTILRGVFTRRLRSILVSTSPPMCIVAALAIWLVRLGRPAIKLWVMDIHPDQLISLGRMAPHSLAASAMEFFNRAMLRRSADIIVLDPFMARTINNKLDVASKMTILPPWPPGGDIVPVEHNINHFRRLHNLGGSDGKRVFMYSGNHGVCLPLKTFLEAAVRFKDHPLAAFVFIGDGVRKNEVEVTIREHGMINMLSLPYEPLDQLRYSLSAADVHLMSVGNELVGVSHPCKIYGAMAAARPVILLAPDPCHVSDLVKGERGQEEFLPSERCPIGWIVPHGDVERAVAVIQEILDSTPESLRAMGERARHVIETTFSKEVLCGALCNVLEHGSDSEAVPNKLYNALVAVPRCFAAVQEKSGVATHNPLPQPVREGWRARQSLGVLKRPFDVALSAIGLIASMPLWALVALAIKMEDGGPIFYSQERVGRGGLLFKSWKFRSMVPDSDKRFGPLQASSNDPRVTWVGRILRSTAMDELPQLWNIFRGDMSFVGPRALVPGEIETKGNGEMIPLERIPGFDERHQIRPGLTGLAQVFVPRDIPRPQKFRYDLLYIKNQSLWLDLKLIGLSIWISLRGNWESRSKKF